MEFVESPLFTKLIYKHLDEDEYRAFQWKLTLNPEKGDLISKSGGLRKIRWNQSGRGKRGGVRIIYYFKGTASQIWLLTIYAKNEVSVIPAHILKKIKEKFIK